MDPMSRRASDEFSINLQSRSSIRVQYRHVAPNDIFEQRDQPASIFHHEICARLLRLLGVAVP